MRDDNLKPYLGHVHVERDEAKKQQTPLSQRQAGPGAAPPTPGKRANARSPLPSTPGELKVSSGSVACNALLHLQRDYGNQYVKRVLQSKSETENEAGVHPDVERAIERSRGGGQALDSGAQAQMGKAFNADFSSVRVHTDSAADGLNRAVNARAFTTGRDVYFRQGEYSPGSSRGRELLAHELTHVVQQNGAAVQGKTEEDGTSLSGASRDAGGLARSIQRKLTLGNPGDVYEQEADNAAKAYSRLEQQPSLAPEAGPGIRRQAGEEEKKEEMMAKPNGDRLSRQAEEEPEEEVQAKLENGAVQRQAEEEEEK